MTCCHNFKFIYQRFYIMKKTILALTTLASLSMASSVMATDSAGQGSITFKGTVLTAACGISPESADQSIDFGQLSSVHLSNGGTSVAKDVNIKLVNCILDDAGSTNNMVKVAFTGKTVVAGELATAGSSAGAVILMTNQGNAVTFDGVAGAEQKFGAGENTLRYTAVVKKAAAATAVTEGQFSAVTNFTMSYN
jgi:major pilin subunit PapA